MSRKYTEITVGTQIYCSSSTDYFTRASWTEQSGEKTFRAGREYWINAGQLTWRKEPYEWEGAPAYLLEEIARQLREMVEKGEARVYEYNRDKIKRYEDLRYHRPNYFRKLCGIEVTDEELKADYEE